MTVFESSSEYNDRSHKDIALQSVGDAMAKEPVSTMMDTCTADGTIFIAELIDIR